jgi:hypothetical protein
MNIGATVNLSVACALRTLCNGQFPRERIVQLTDGYTVAAYATAMPDATGFIAYAKIFRVPAVSYWDALPPLYKFCGQQIHPSSDQALEDALDVAFMSLVNEGAIRSEWAPLTGSPEEAASLLA